MYAFLTPVFLEVWPREPLKQNETAWGQQQEGELMGAAGRERRKQGTASACGLPATCHLLSHVTSLTTGELDISIPLYMRKPRHSMIKMYN